MDNSLLVGIWRIMVNVPPALWNKALAKETQTDLSFMTPDHHRVRDFVVREMPRLNAPISPDTISAGVNLPCERVRSILDELEQGLTFLFRNERGEVTWAYPVTVAKTPHRITFSSGEKLYAA